MKKFVITILLTVFSMVSFAQEKGTFFQRIRDIFVVHDTIYIYADSLAHEVDSLAGFEELDELEDEEDEQEELEGFGGIPTPIDTIDTDDKFR